MLIVAWFPLLAGCGDDPRALLEAMRTAYRSAPAYADDARVVVRQTRDGRVTERTLPHRVAFVRPDRLRVEAYDARIVVDGRTLHAAVGGVPGQVLVEPVTSPLTLDQLCADDVVSATLAEGEAGCPIQLPLLLADDTLDLILAEATTAPRITGVEEIDGRRCARVAIGKPDGLLELWIDRESKLLRRMRVPSDAYGELLSRQAGIPTALSVVVDFTAASFSDDVPPEAFAFEMPARATAVRRLEPLETPQETSGLVGRRIELPPLAAIDGTTVSGGSLAGAPVVVEFFFEGCRPSTITMPQVADGIARFVSARARERRGERPTVHHLAVSIDGPDVSADGLRKQVAQCGGVGRIVRDPEGVAATALGIDRFPAVVVLAADGTVADVHQGPHGRLTEDVADTLHVLAAGDDAARHVRDRRERRLREYRLALERAVGTAEGSVARESPTVILPRRQPVRFKVSRAWRAAAVGLPGNLLCLDEARGSAEGEERIVVLDGWRTVVELDALGRTVARRELTLPRDSGVTFLRTALDGDRRRWWLAGSRGGSTVFVFTDDWRLHATLPLPGSAPGETITDARLVDLDGDGGPEVVIGYAASAGLEATRLDGRPMWEAREIAAVSGIAADTGGQPHVGVGLWCAPAAGGLVPVSGSGAIGRPLDLDGRTLRSIEAGPVAAGGGWALVGIAEGGAGRPAAVGIDPATGPTWHLELPTGSRHPGPIEPLAWADLLGSTRRQWLLAEADGTVTVCWADGGVVDRYRHGRPLAGIGGYRRNGGGFIVLAGPDGVEALEVGDVALD